MFPEIQAESGEAGMCFLCVLYMCSLQTVPYVLSERPDVNTLVADCGYATIK